MTCDVNKIDSNVTGLSYAEEECLKVLPILATDGHDPTWYGLEPNSYADFGGQLSSVARQPISATRQNQKGTITGNDVSGGFNSDLTQTNLTRLLQGFFFADAREKVSTHPLNGTQIVITGVATSDDSFAAAAGLGVFTVGHLIKASGFTLNNGLFNVATIAAGKVTVTQNLTDEASPPAGAKIEEVGMQCASGDCALTVSAAVATLTLTAGSWPIANLVAGEWVFVGGDAVATQFPTVASTNRPGYARIRAVTAKILTLDETTWTPQADAGTAKTIQVFFGTVIRNEPSPANIKTRSYHLERTLGQDSVGTQAQYLKGAIANELKINFKEGDKLDADLTFIALDDETVNGTTGLKTGARVNAPGESAFNTAQDLYRIKMAIHDATAMNQDALFGFVTAADVTVKNNASQVKALGVLGAIDVSVGNFDASGSVTALFSTVEALASIRNNADVGINYIAARANSGFVLDIPLLGLGGGRLAVALNTPITVPLDQNGAENALGYTMLSNWFSYLPTAAMPDAA